MKQPSVESSWPEVWKASYEYDLMEVFGQPGEDYGYTYAYAERHRQTLRAVQRFVPSGGQVLDVAAAQGNFTLALAEQGYEVTWNDLREELVEYVKRKHQLGRIHFAPGNCFELQFPDAFDAVLITEIIEHVAHPDDFISKIKSLVKPGGVIIMTTPHGGYFRYRYPRFSECADPSQYEAMQFGPNADSHIFLFHTDEVVQLAEQAGVRLLELRLFANPLTHGHLKTERLLRAAPKSLINTLEALTSVGNGWPLRKINAHMLAVFRRPHGRQSLNATPDSPKVESRQSKSAISSR